MKAPALPTYTETLGAALDAVREHFTAKGFTFGENAFDAFAFGGVAYQTNKTASVPCVNAKGKEKFVSVSLYRMQSGRYELTAYAC